MASQKGVSCQPALTRHFTWAVSIKSGWFLTAQMLVPHRHQHMLFGLAKLLTSSRLQNGVSHSFALNKVGVPKSNIFQKSLTHCNITLSPKYAWSQIKSYFTSAVGCKSKLEALKCGQFKQIQRNQSRSLRITHRNPSQINEIWRYKQKIGPFLNSFF